MSTINVTNVKHPSAVDPAIVLDADGDVTYAGVHDFSGATVTGAPQGLVHVATESFSAVSSVSLNGVFTSAYENYRIFISGAGTESAGTNLRIRLRSSGSDATTTSYFFGITSVTNTAGPTRTYGQAETSGVVGFFGNANNSFAVMDIFNPTSTTRNKQITTQYGSGSSTVVLIANAGNLIDVPTTSFDGFTLFPAAGTMTGTIRIYGYRNA
jgi:hypothetical protein